MKLTTDRFPTHVCEVRPRKDHRGVDLISDVLPFGGLWYGEPNSISNAIGYAEHFSRSHDAVIRVDDAIAASANRRFQFRNRNQLIIRAHNTLLAVAAMCVSNPDYFAATKEIHSHVCDDW